MCSVLAALLATVALPCAAADINVTGDLITISGHIERGELFHFRNVVENLTQPMRVVLDGPGGGIGDAIAMGRLIRERGWNTYTWKTCASACGLLWLSGVKRYKAAYSLVGCHRSRPGLNDFAPNPAGDKLVESYLRDLGYSQAVIEYALSTSSSSMRWLNAGDIKRLGLAVEEPPAVALTNVAPHVKTWAAEPQKPAATWPDNKVTYEPLKQVLRAATPKP